MYVYFANEIHRNTGPCIMNAKRDQSEGALTEAVFHALLRTLGLLRQVMKPYFARFGISGPQWGILRALQRAEAHGERDLRLSDLGQRLFIRPPGITGLIDRMERRGLVRRSPSKQDLRARRLSLTPLSRGLIAHMRKSHAQQVRSLFRALDPTQMEQMRGLLTRLAADLQTLVGRPTRGQSEPRRSRRVET